MRERHCSEWSTAHSRPTLVVTTSPPSAHPNCSKSFLHSGARRTCRNSGTGGGTGTAACGCNTGRSDSNATAIVFKCVRCQFAAACFVQRTAAHIQCPWWTPWNCLLLYPAWRAPCSPRTLASSPGCCIEADRARPDNRRRRLTHRALATAALLFARRGGGGARFEACRAVLECAPRHICPRARS